MAEVKLLSGSLKNLPDEIRDGQVYFVIVDEKERVGQIVLDKGTKRYVMSAPETKNHSLIIGDIIYDGTEDVIVPSYGGDYNLQ